MGDQQLLHEHISRLERDTERWSNNPAPTVPIYDLTATIAPAAVDATLQVLLGSYFSPVDQVICDICADNSGVPGGVLYTSTPTTVTTAALYNFNFTSISLTSGTTYWFVLRRTGTLTSSDFYTYYGGGGAGPHFAWWNGSAWNLSSGVGLDSTWTVDGVSIFGNTSNGISGLWGIPGSLGYAEKVAADFVA